MVDWKQQNRTHLRKTNPLLLLQHRRKLKIKMKKKPTKNVLAGEARRLKLRRRLLDLSKSMRMASYQLMKLKARLILSSIILLLLLRHIMTNRKRTI